jgi:hypothetical protein
LTITFLPDRFPKAELLQKHPNASNSLAYYSPVMMENRHETVAWVGVAQTQADAALVFLPHGAPEDHASQMSFAETLMKAIVRFSRENSRQGDSRGEDGATQTALLADFACDFRDHGLYTTREKIRTLNHGKPNWARTIKSNIAFPASDGTLIYCDLSTTRYSTFATSLIAAVQEQIVCEIAKSHGWWLSDYFGEREIPYRLKPIEWPRVSWAGLLKSVRHGLFERRAIGLVQMMLDYLDATAETGVGNIICGVSDFSSMWEAMLRQTLDNVEGGWNELLPSPHYIGVDGKKEEAGRMRLDIVVRDKGQISILDAKYYRATSVKLAPSLADITKIVYQHALETCIDLEQEAVKSAFVFPARETVQAPFERLDFISRKGHVSSVFPVIYCHYVSMGLVVSAYATRAKLKDQTWLTVKTMEGVEK